MFKPDGSFPWEVSGASSSTASVAVMIFHGRKYHRAVDYVARTNEQLVKLEVEKKRLLRWIDHANARVKVALERICCGADAKIDESAVVGLYASDSLDVGKSFILNRWLSDLSCMKEKVSSDLAIIP